MRSLEETLQHGPPQMKVRESGLDAADQALVPTASLWPRQCLPSGQSKPGVTSPLRWEEAAAEGGHGIW